MQNPTTIQSTRKLKAAVISIGQVKMTTGATMHGWSIYKGDSDPLAEIALTTQGRLLYSAPGTFKIGDDLQLRDSDSNRLKAEVVVVDICTNEKETILEMLYKHEYDYYKKGAFKKLRWSRKLVTSFAVKGVSDRIIKA